jgi:putative ABC transport system permease protein
MSEVLRNMTSRKNRTMLTMLGIVIGMLAVTVMGSLSEYLTITVAKFDRVAETQIAIQARADGPPLGMRVVEQVRRTPGVLDAIPFFSTGLAPEDENETQFISVQGYPPDTLPRLYAWPGLEEGRWLTDLDVNAALVSHNYAVQNKVKVGDEIRGEDRTLTVVGKLRSTGFGLGDTTVYVPLETARKIAKAPTGMSGIVALVSSQAEGDAIARQIGQTIPDIEVKSPSQQKQENSEGMVTFYAIIWTGAIIATVVGALSVANTMFMAVTERTREIGIKKAVGAKDWMVLREFMLEAVMVSLVGGLIGMVLGWGVASLMNALGGPDAGIRFFVTARLVVFGMAFSSVIGLVAGLIPAWNATRLDPVAALRL